MTKVQMMTEENKKDEIIIDELLDYFKKMRFPSRSDARAIIYRLRGYDKMRMRTRVLARVHDGKARRLMISIIEDTYG